MRRILLCCCLPAMLVLGVSCNGSDNGKPDSNDVPDGEEQDGTGDESQPDPVLVWSERMEVDSEDVGSQLQLRATPDGQFAVAYFKRLDEQTECTEPVQGETSTPSHQDAIRYAKYDGSAWSIEEVATVSTIMLSGISLEFDGDTPLIAYLGGTPYGGRQVCGGTDLVVASGPEPWTEATAVALSNEAAAGADCPRMQAICDFGDVVGLWPSLARDPVSGTIGVVYRDIHNGYTKEADDSSDLEYAFTSGGGWGHEWVDLGWGSGDFNSLAFGSDGQPAVAYYNGEAGTILFAKRQDLDPARPWGEYTQAPTCDTAADCLYGEECGENRCWCYNDSQCEAPKRCVEKRCSIVIDRLDSGLDEGSISLAVGQDGRYLIAYFDVDDKNLRIAHSPDGINWENGRVDSEGSTGMYPTIAIDPRNGNPGIAYYRCSDYHPNELVCNPNQDGPRFAYFNGSYPDELTVRAKWIKSDIRTPLDTVGMDGQKISVAISQDGTVGVAYAYSWVNPSDNVTQRLVMAHIGTWQDP